MGLGDYWKSSLAEDQGAIPEPADPGPGLGNFWASMSQEPVAPEAPGPEMPQEPSKPTLGQRAVKLAAAPMGLAAPIGEAFLGAATGVEPRPERALDPLQKAIGLEDYEPRKALYEGAKSVVRGTTRGLDTAADIISEWTGFKKGGAFGEVAKLKKYEADDSYYERLEAKEGFGKYLEEVTGMAPQIISQVAAGALTGGAGSGLFMAAQIAGLEYEDKINRGIDPEAARKTSWLSALMQMPLEMIGLGLAFRNPITRKFLKGGFKKFLAGRIEGGITEGLTEFLQSFPSNFWDRMAQDPNFLQNAMANPKLITDMMSQAYKEGLHEGAVALPFGAIMGVGGGKGVKAKPGDKTTNLLDKDKPEAPEAVGQRADANQILEAAAARVEGVIPEPGGPAPVVQAVPPMAETPEQTIMRSEERLGLEDQAAETLAPSARRLTPEQELRPRPFPPQVGVTMDQPKPMKKEVPDEKAYQAIPETFPKQIAVTSRQPVVKKPVITEDAKQLTAEDLATMPLSELEKVPVAQRAKAISGEAATPAEVKKLTQDAEKLIAKGIVQDLKVAEKETDKKPTQAQIKSDSYDKGKISFEGMGIEIETPKGTIRTGTDKRGKKWSQKMNVDYGRFTDIVGADGEELDVAFRRSNNPNDYKNVFVIDQLNPYTKKFDEHKVYIGYSGAKQAKMGYLANYEKGWKGLGPVTKMSINEFKSFSKRMDRKRPVSGQITITKDQWLNDPDVRPAGYSKAEYREGAIGPMAVITNKTIIKEYETWIEPKQEKIKSRIKKDIISVRPYMKEKDITFPKPKGQVARTINKIADFFNVPVFFINAPGFAINGAYFPALGSIGISTTTKNPPLTLFGHEINHLMAQENKALYDEMADYLWKELGQKEYLKWLDSYNLGVRMVAQYSAIRKYGKTKATKKRVDAIYDRLIRTKKHGEEYIGYAVGKLFNQQSFWNRLAEKNQSLFERIGKFVLNIIKTMKAVGKTPKFDAEIKFNKDIDEIASHVADIFNRFALERRGTELTDSWADIDAAVSFDEDGKAPKKTIKAYKLFRTLKTRPGELFPLFIGKTESVPVGKWLEAKMIPTKGFAQRPGWHTGVMPRADHLLKKDGTMAADRVWAEVELPNDVDWQPIADKSKTRDIRNKIPKGGLYRFNRTAYQGGTWMISGSMKVNKILTDKEVDAISAADEEAVSKTYNEAVKKAGPKDNLVIKDGDSKYAMVQISSSIGKQEAAARGEKYYDKLYSKREGYERPEDFWELPEWSGQLANTFSDIDAVIVRDPKKAATLLNAGGYQSIFFSAMDANKATIKDIAKGFDGKVYVGGYIDKNYFNGVKNVTFVNSVKDAAMRNKVPYKEGVDWRHFKGTKTIPRLECSQGCKHSCAFCTVSKKIVEKTKKGIDDQIRNFKGLDFKLVYLNDKTFGQASNYKYLKDINKKLKKINPGFQGFIVQTTAPQFLKLDDQWLKGSGIKFVELGAESFNDKILKAVNKPHNEKLLEQAARKLRRLEINYIPNVMVGLAGTQKGKVWTEDETTYQNTLDYLERNKDIISHVNVYVLATYEGTKISEQIGGGNVTDSDENVIEKSWMKDRKIHDRFYDNVLAFGSRQLDKTPKAVDEVVEVTDAPMFDEQVSREGSKGSISGNMLYDDITDISKEAGGWKKIGNFLETAGNWKGIAITPKAVKFIGNIGMKLSKDAKLRNKVKAIEAFRKKLAAGDINEYSPEYAKAHKKYGADLRLHTVPRQKRFFVGVGTIYGPKQPGDITETVKKQHAIFGEFKTTITRDKKFKLVMDTPILSPDANTRQNQIDSIIKENKKYLGWYEDWNSFIKQFKRLPEAKLIKYIKMMAVFSAGSGPQGNMKQFTLAANKLESGQVLKAGSFAEGGDGIAKNDLPKIMAIWNDQDPATTLEERRDIYGPKVGTYMHVGLFPHADAIVIDRHMPRLWGYDITWSPNMKHSAFRIMPQVEAQIVSDIRAASQRNNISPSAVQAALWYKSRTPDVEASTYREAAAMKPSEYLPGVLHAGLRPESLGIGKHFKTTPLKKGEFILATKRDGTIKYNSYSRDDIGNRIYGHTEQNPYAELVYLYEAGTKPEQQLKGKKNVYTVDLDLEKIYDGVNDPLGYWKFAAERLKNDPFANLTNIFSNMVEGAGGFDGFVINAPVGTGRWVMMFKQAEITGVPENIVAGISDVVESLETSFPQTIKGIKAIFNGRADKLYKKFKSLNSQYAEVKEESFKPTVARFQGATQGKHEISGMASIRGPLKAARAMMAEFGISNIQNNVIMVHTEEGVKRNGTFYRFKVKRDFETIEDVYKEIASYGLEDYNISVNPVAGSFFVEQFVIDDYPDSFVDSFSKMIKDVADSSFPQNVNYRATSEVLGDPNWTGIPAKALKHYRKNLTDYFGIKEGNQRYAKSIKEAQGYKKEIREREAKRPTVIDIDERIEEGRGQNYNRPVEGQDIIGQFANPGSLEPQLDEAAPENLYSGIWYSQLMQAVDTKKFPNKSKASHIKSLLENMAKKGQIKQTELDWSGITYWLDYIKGPVTKSEILEFLEKNHVKLEETILGGRLEDTEAGRRVIADSILDLYQTDDESSNNAWGLLADELETWVIRGDNLEDYNEVQLIWDEIPGRGSINEWIRDVNDEEGEVEYTQYTVDEEGSPEYREILINMVENQNITAGAIEALDWYMKKKGQKMPPRLGEGTKLSEQQRKYSMLAKMPLYKLQKEKAPEYLIRQFKRWQNSGDHKIPHWQTSAPQDVVAHMRVDGKEIDGKRTLFIEEIQSDWAQKGRKVGYIDLSKGAPVGYHTVRTRVPVEKGDPQIKYKLVEIMNNKETPWGIAIFEPAAQRYKTQIIKPSLRIGKFVTEFTFETKEQAERELKILLEDQRNRGFKTKTQLYEDSTGKLLGEGDYESDAIEDAGFSPGKFVKQTPFKMSKDWGLLVLKRAVRYAAENGYDQIAWTGGKIQTDRYQEAFRKRVDAIYYNRKTGLLRAFFRDAEVYQKNLKSDDELSDYVGEVNAAELLKQNVFKKDELIGFIKGKRNLFKRFKEYVLENSDLTEDDVAGILYPSMLDYTIGDWSRMGPEYDEPMKLLQKSGIAKEYEQLKIKNKVSPNWSDENIEDGDAMLEGENIIIDEQGMTGFYDEIIPGVFKRFFSKKAKWGKPELKQQDLGTGKKDRLKMSMVGNDYTFTILEGGGRQQKWNAYTMKVAVANYLDAAALYTPNQSTNYQRNFDILGYDIKQAIINWYDEGLLPEGYYNIHEYINMVVAPAMRKELGTVGKEEPIWVAPVTGEMKKLSRDEGFPMFDEDVPVPADTKPVLQEKIGRKDKKLSNKILESTTEFMDNWKTKMVDRLNPIKDMLGGESNAYMLHRGLPGVQSTFNAFMEHGKLKMNEDGSITTDENKQGFLEWMKSLGKDAEKFLYWQIAKRSEVLKGEDRELLLTDADRQKIYDWVGEAPVTRDSWQEISDEFAEWNQNMLDIAISGGLLSKEQLETWQRDFYIPFYRIFEDEQAKMEFVRGPAKGKKYISAQIKRLRGSEQRMGDPMENIIKNWSALLTNSVTNRARKEAFDYANDNNIMTGLMRIDEKTGKEEPVPLLEEIPWSKTVIFKPMKGGLTFVQEKTGDPVLAFKDGGKSVFFKVNDPELFGALGAINKEYFDNVLMKFMSGSKRLLTLGATVTPAFRIANMLRDTLHTFQISKNFMPFWDTARGFLKIWRNNPEYAMFMASGHAFGGSYVRAEDPKAMKRYVDRIAKKEGAGARNFILDTPAKMWRFWESVGEASENAARVQLYSNLKKAGKSHGEAAFAARDLMDFQMSGGSGVVQFLIQTVPFLNARVQGLYKMGRSFADNPKGFLTKGALISVASIALWALYADDDRYKELEDWEKWAYYHFWIGDHHFRIPKPFETGVIFSSSVEAAANVAAGNDEPKLLMKYLGHAFLETFAFNPVPQVIRPAAEVYMNKSFFTGRPIESMSKKRLKPGERYDPWTSESLRVLGSQLNISPKKAEALVRGYTAGLGMGILAMSDYMVRNLADFPERPARDIGDYPGIGRFVKGKVSRYTKHMSRFYELYEEVDQITATVNNYKRYGDFQKANELASANRKLLSMRKGLGAARKQLGDISLQMRKVWYSKTLNSDQKYNKIQQLTERRNKIVKIIYDRYIDRK